MIDLKEIIKIPYKRNGRTVEEGFDCYTFMVFMRDKYFNRESPIVTEASTTGVDVKSLIPIFGRYVSDQPYIKVDKPMDGDIVLMSAKEGGNYHHCGFWYKKYVLHCMRKDHGGSAFAHEMKLIKRLFKKVDFYREA